MPDHDHQKTPIPTQQKAATPFLKWAGGKGRLLGQYDAFFPEEAKTYFEPFVGSGAVFFHLQKRNFAQKYCLSDVNIELINVYRIVRDQVDALIELLAGHKAAHELNNENYFYTVRAWDRDETRWAEKADVERAARMIYLNKTCYNGLWRVNSKGQFNVPLGRYDNPAILDEPRLRVASTALQSAHIEVRDFHAVVDEAQAGDFVYFDPPYVPLSPTANFTSYSENDFGEDEQRALAEAFRQLDESGVSVMLSNSDMPLVHQLYGSFRIKTVQARRAINTDADKRGPINEIVVLNY